MNILHDIDDARITPEEFISVIEIPKGSKAKYEIDKETGLIMLDRVLHTSMQYPANYGFIPRTLCGDGDALDVFVLCSEVLVPLTLVKSYPIGMLEMIDGGEQDEKIIAVAAKDPYFKNFKDISELPKHVTDEIIHFFTNYKALEAGSTKILPPEGRAKAVKMVATAKELYKKSPKK